MTRRCAALSAHPLAKLADDVSEERKPCFWESAAGGDPPGECGASVKQEAAQPLGIVVLDGVPDGGSLDQLRAPGGHLGQIGEEAELADRLEHVEVTEHRAECRIDDAETFATEIRAGAEGCFDLPEAVVNVPGLVLQGRLVGCALERPDGVQQRGAELDPGPVLRALNGQFGMQAWGDGVV